MSVRRRAGRARGSSMVAQARVKQAVKQSLAWVSLGRRASNAVLLTFDDGPHPESTPAVLSLLRRYNARAIFFVVGQRIPRAPHLLERILEEGHALGNHSYSHPAASRPPLGPYLKDLARCQREVERLTGERPRFFRPPLGRLSFSSLVAPRLLGLKTVLWSVDAYDWDLKSGEEAREAAARLGERVAAPGERPGDIVLMHDDHRYTGEILEAVLPRLAARGCDLHSALDSVR